jgi:hypothetical protein
MILVFRTVIRKILIFRTIMLRNNDVVNSMAKTEANSRDLSIKT